MNDVFADEERKSCQFGGKDGSETDSSLAVQFLKMKKMKNEEEREKCIWQ